jgi:hypothetical protein
LIAAAAPILRALAKVFSENGIPPVPENAADPNEGGNFPESDGLNQEQKPGLADYFEKAVDIAKSTGIIPDRPNTGVLQRVDEAIPGDDHDIEAATGGKKTSFGINPLLLVGVAAGAYLLTRKK